MSNQRYYSSAPNQQPSSPNQQYSAPNQQYSPPNQQYSAPNQQYSAPNQQYSAPNQQYSPAPPNQQYSAPSGPRPGNQPPHPADTDLLPQGQERSEQMEHMQNYEAHATQTEDDVNQATLQKEFPNIDSSLIAAIYGDSKSLSATREMLQELSSTD